MSSLHRVSLFLLSIGVLLITAVNVCYGSITIPISELFDDRWQYIVWHSRMPASITAILTGAALGTSGLLLQTYFRNPLAGPSILGITNGANLMVSLLTLAPVSFSFLQSGTPSMPIVVFAAMLGSMAVLGLLLLLGRYVQNTVTLLITGILISYLTSAIITLLSYQATAQGLQQLMLWGMGDFSSVGYQGLPFYSFLIILGLILAILMVRPMNGWMLGEDYARSLGFNPRNIRFSLLAITGLLSAVTTAWCGPIAFVGLSMPHAARLITPTDDHRVLLPITMLLGALCCGICLRLSTWPNGGVLLPINALTPILGIPIIVYVLLRK